MQFKTCLRWCNMWHTGQLYLVRNACMCVTFTRLIGRSEEPGTAAHSPLRSGSLEQLLAFYLHNQHQLKCVPPGEGAPGGGKGA
jgi:hypothetical protein